MLTLKTFVEGVPIEPEVWTQVEKLNALSFVKHVAIMPDAHVGTGSTVGSVIATDRAIIPACVGVDIGCGMDAIQTSLKATDLPDTLHPLRLAIEAAIPTGGPGRAGSWQEPGRSGPPGEVLTAWRDRFDARYHSVVARHPHIDSGMTLDQLGTLGTGNHFIEICLDENQNVWIMLHSGSRGLGNRVGSYFIEKAKEEMRRWHINLPDVDLSYLASGTQYYDDYIEAMELAQEFALANRQIMMGRVVNVLRDHVRPMFVQDRAISCHHNYVARERYRGNPLWITRKGAVKAGRGDLGIIPSSMGTPSFITSGLGNMDSLMSSSHGTGRTMSRTQAKKTITIEQHEQALSGIECDKSSATLDESPASYKNADLVMNAQRDLVQIVYKLNQVLNVKGTK